MSMYWFTVGTSRHTWTNTSGQNWSLKKTWWLLLRMGFTNKVPCHLSKCAILFPMTYLVFVPMSSFLSWWRFAEIYLKAFPSNNCDLFVYIYIYTYIYICLTDYPTAWWLLPFCSTWHDGRRSTDLHICSDGLNPPTRQSNKILPYSLRLTVTNPLDYSLNAYA